MNKNRSVKTWSTPVVEEERELVPCALCGGRYFKPSLVCDGFAYVRCTGCGLVQMNPQPFAANVERRYRESFGDDYLTYQLKNEMAFLELQKLALADAHFFRIEKDLMERKAAFRLPDDSPSVLDIGCATGTILAFLKERGWKATGVEISPSAEYARLKWGLDIRNTILEECRFSDGSFDLVLASHLVEHLNNPLSFIREVWRVLRPGARLLLTTPNIDGFQARLFGSRWRSAIFDHLYLFSARTVRAMLSSAGFVCEGVYTWGGLAAGTVPPLIKHIADKAVKILGCGDVMLVKALKPEN